MTTLQAYNTLKQPHKLPPMQPGSVNVRSQEFDDPQQLWTALQSLRPTQGWLMFQSSQMSFHDGLPVCHSQWGWLLSCEAVTAAGNSLAIVQNDHGGWRLIEYIPDSENSGLCDEVRQFAHVPGTGMLCYRRYWADEQEQGYVQKHACFIGFERGE